MKIKNLFCLLVSLLTAIHPTLAQTAVGSIDSTSSSTDQLIPNQQIVQKTPTENYAIESLDHSVVAAEYCTFLSDISAPQEELTLDAVQQKYLGTGSAISCIGTCGHYQFIIQQSNSLDHVTTIPSKEVQDLFNHWRQNPTSIELASYLYYRIQIVKKIHSNSSTYVSEAEKIKNAYPNSTTLPKADKIAVYTVGPITFYSQNKNPLLTIPQSQLLVMDNLVSNLKKIPDYYHRPSIVTRGEVPISD
jgi:hypothetical protein